MKRAAQLSVLLAGLGAAVWAATARPAKTWVVNSIDDVSNSSCDTTCTLRDALFFAGTGDTIAFAIGTGHQRISLTDGLTVGSSVTIDGTTQPGFSGSPLIELNCEGAAITALTLSAGLTTVKGLVITNGCGVGLFAQGGGNTIQGNFIGTDWTGAFGGSLVDGIDTAANNQIGGTSAALRNVIAADQNAISLGGDGNRVQGNYINMNAAGDAALGLGKIGIRIEAAGNTIGGFGAGTRNVINAPGPNGDGIFTEFDSGTLIQNNYIGTDAAGFAKLQVYNGIHLRSINVGVAGVQIGGTDPGTGNVISGASNAGIFVDHQNRLPTIQGNYIGTDKTGTFAIGNKYGIWDLAGAATIGGTDGTTPGGACTGACNLISGNEIGILEAGIHPDSTAVPIQGNIIGLTVAGAQGVLMGNSQIGIKVYNGSGRAAVGGTATGAGNRIAFNGATNTTGFGGVVILDSSDSCPILSNSIYSNGGLGIDLGGNGVTANDALDADNGPNSQQNYPVITSVVTTGSSTVVQGSLSAYVNTTYSLQFFTNPSCDPSGHGQGKKFVGSWIVTTDGTGNRTFTTASIGGTAPAGEFLTATATGPFNDTSEFSACVQVVAGTAPTDTPTKTPTQTKTPTLTPTPTRTPAAGTPTPTPAPPALVPVSVDTDPFPNPSLSDGNGIFEPGEAVRVQPSWRNTTTIPVSVGGTASQFEGPGEASIYFIAEPLAHYGPIAAGAVGHCSGTDCYNLSIGPLILTRPVTHWDATFRETLDTNESKVWTLHIGKSFDDVNTDHPFYRQIEAMLHNGITSGCSQTSYCPDAEVSRSAMAIFIAKGVAGGGPNIPVSGTAGGKPYNCMPGGQSIFTDVLPTDSFCRHAHYLVMKNVSLGCSPTQFCPSAAVSRDAMAAFVAKALVAPGGGPAVPWTYADPMTSLSYSCEAASPDLHFTDVLASDPFCRHIHYLWARGIIAGCGGTNYCPMGEVQRGAMAKFLVNGFKLSF